MKSKWKLNIPHRKFLRRKTLNQIKERKRLFIRFYNKQSLILNNMLDLTLRVYNGKKFVEYVIKDYMLGKPIGSFILTKKITNEIHLKSEKNAKKKKLKKK